MEEVLEFDLEDFDISGLLAPKETILRKWSFLKTMTIRIISRKKHQDIVQYFTKLQPWVACFNRSLEQFHQSKMENFSIIFDFDPPSNNHETSIFLRGWIELICQHFPLLKTFSINMAPLVLDCYDIQELMVIICDNLKYISSFTLITGNASNMYWSSIRRKDLAETSITHINFNNYVLIDNIDLCRRIEEHGPYSPFSDIKEIFDQSMKTMLRKNKRQRKFFAEIFFILYLGVKKRLGLLGLINKDCVTEMMQYLEPRDLYHDSEKEKQKLQYAEKVIKANKQYVSHVQNLQSIDANLCDLKKRKRELEADKTESLNKKIKALAELNKIIKDGRGA